MALLRRKAKANEKPIEERAALEQRLEGLSAFPFQQNPPPGPSAAPAHAAPAPINASPPQFAAERAGVNPASAKPSPNVKPKAAKIRGASAKLREHAKPQRLKGDYRRLLFWLHGSVFDTPVERLFFAPTKTPVSVAGLSVRGPNKALAHDYRPTPAVVFDCALAAVEDDLSRFTFVDYGAGKGRVLMMAAQHPFRSVLGVEFAEELHDDAMMNIAQFPRSQMKCRNVECLLQDAANMEAVNGEAVHYFFDPFERQVFAHVLARIVHSYHAHPRRLYLILVDTDAGDLIHRTGIFQKVELPYGDRMKARFLSPYPINVFRSLA